MAGFTNRGKTRLLEAFFRGQWDAGALPTNLYIFLATSAVAPTPDINTKGELTEIAAGNGYSAGGIALSRNTTDFDTLTEDDAGDLGKVLLKDIVWTASGGPIPASGGGARYAILTDDNATPGSRQVIAYWDLGGDTTVGDGATLTLADFDLRGTET